jgi:hypothetical protein
MIQAIGTTNEEWVSRNFEKESSLAPFNSTARHYNNSLNASGAAQGYFISNHPIAKKDQRGRYLGMDLEYPK